MHVRGLAEEAGSPILTCSIDGNVAKLQVIILLLTFSKTLTHLNVIDHQSRIKKKVFP